MLSCREHILLCIILLLVSCNWIPAANSADITINNARTTQQSLTEYDSLTITGSGSVTTVTNNTPAASGSSSNEGSNHITLQSGAEIITSGADTGSGISTGSHGIKVYGNGTDNSISGLAGTGTLEYGASNVIILQSGSSISTSGGSSVGIFSGDNNLIRAYGTIRTTGIDACGIYVADNNDISVGGSIITLSNGADGLSLNKNNNVNISGDITTYGFLAYGINASSTNNTINLLGSITTYGSMSSGFYGVNNNDITVSAGGSIKTTGYASTAIACNSSNQFDIRGTITTTGDEADAIGALSGNNMDFSGSIVTAGSESSGIRAIDNNSITASGTILTHGDAAYGISVRDGNNVDFSGTITTYGASIQSKFTCASGISGSDDNTITSSGTIITYGPDATGIDVLDNNIITMSGSIITSGSWSFGIYGFDNNTITSSGTITTTGNNASGIDIEDNNIITLSGSVSTTGTAAHAVNLFNNNNVCYLSGSISATGTGAYAINSGNNESTDPAPAVDRNCVHILRGASITGDIHNDDATATSCLTFGYARDNNDQAVLTAADNSFNITLNGDILSSSTGNWDGYLAGGTTTLNGTTNTFRNIFIGGDCFDGTTVAGGNDGSGSARTVNLTSISGATSVLNVMKTITTTGDVTVGTGSAYNLYGTHTGAGDLTLLNNANLNLFLNRGRVSRLSLTGSVNLSAGDTTITARGGQSGRTYTMIEANSITGSVSLADYSALLNYTVDRSNPGRVSVISYLIPNGYQDAAGTGDGTNASIAEAMAALSDNHPASMDSLYGRMNEFTTFTEVDSALSQLNIINSTASSINLALNSARRFDTTLSRQFSDFRLGNAASAYGSGAGYTTSGGTVSPSELSAAYTSLENQRYQLETRDTWAGFARIYGGFGEQKSIGDRSGYDYSQACIMSGMSYIFSPEFRLGGVFDYSHGNSTIYNNMGSGSDDVFRLGSFAAWQWDSFFASLTPSFALHMIETERNISFLYTGARNERTGIDTNLLGCLGYDFELDNGLTITPGYALAFTGFFQPGYTETGAASGANLKVNSFATYSLQQSLDLKLSRLFRVNRKVSLLPEVWGGWELEYLDSATTITSAFAAAPQQTWNTNITTIPSNRAFFGGAVTALLNENTSVLCRYDHKIWSGGYDAGFSIGVKISF